MIVARSARFAAQHAWRPLIVAVALAAPGGLFAGSAVGAGLPALGITMAHLNAYGAECETLEKATKEGCVDPLTGSPATFARESGDDVYLVTVSNTGEEKTSGTVTMVDTLPAGMVAGDFSGARASSLEIKTHWKCKAERGGTVYTCSNKEVLPAKASYPQIPLPVLVQPQAANPSFNEVTASGGGAAKSTTKKEGEGGAGPEETGTDVTPAVPFGIKSFSTNIYAQPTEPLTEPLKEPFGEAGEHPFAVTTEIVFNYTTSTETSNGSPNEAKLVAAGGGAKEIQAEVPAGFVGDPQNAPTCPIQSLFGNKCPEDTAVGYAQATLKGTIEKGKPVPLSSPEAAKTGKGSSLVYNLAPSAGLPAEFGFLIAEGVPFVLDAKVRSDGDYGVTVGDSAVGEKPIATRVTLCENGAEGENNKVFSCKKAPETARPFLTNFSECPSTPVWTVSANAWYEPSDRVSQSVEQAPALKCGSKPLTFKPAVEFQPSPASEGGTTQADKPTGVTVHLSVPQTNEAKTPATPDVKSVSMTLPAGMTVSPSAANGLEACSNAAFGLGTEFEAGNVKLPEGVKPTEPAKRGNCPTASQIGTVEVFTPLLSGAPRIEGVEKPGEELRCTQGTWSNGPWSLSGEQHEAGVEELENGNHKERLKLSYEWLRDNEGSTEAIAGATTSRYTPVKEDEGKPVQCRVTARNEAGSSVAASRATVVIPFPKRELLVPLEGGKRFVSPPLPTAPASVAVTAPSGTAVGNTLTCTSEAWTGNGTSLAYQWLRDSAAISGATKASYELAPEDAGKVIQCQITGSDEYEEEAVKGKAVKHVQKTIADSAAAVAAPAPSQPPLPGAALQGELFVAEPECSPCKNEDAEDGKLFRLFLQVESPSTGVIAKLYGKSTANTSTGQLTTTFAEQPKQPFELLQVKLKGGPRATLANPQTCGPATTVAKITPWTLPETALEPTSSFEVSGCAATMPFSPAFEAGTTGAGATTAGADPSFLVTLGREDGEQDLSGVEVRMPPGLTGKIAGLPRCGEAELHAAEANTGECPAASKIGTATSGAGPGEDPFYTEGNVYFTGPTTLKNGLHGPFGLAVVTLAKTKAFNLGNVVVRSAIDINPYTAAVTVTSDPLPQFVDGVQLRLRKVIVNVNRPGFLINPTNCSGQQITATLSAAQGGAANVGSPFGLRGCTSLPFAPRFTASTQANTSKAEGASLDVKVTYPPGSYANIAKTLTELPVQLPSRLTTLQKACVDSVFEANPAACPEGSVVGIATARTPLLASPLSGPAYLVSHGSAAFPDLEVVLQGEGVEVRLDGQSDIKKGITRTTFNALPDSPVETFELNLPEGPHSVLAANAPPCSAALTIPTTLTGQNGAVVKQITPITVTGCPPTIAITKTKVSGNALLVTVKSSAKGTVKISGRGLKTVTRKNLAAGTHQIRVALTKAGKSLRKHHKKVSVHVSLTVGRQAVANSATVRL